MEEKEFLREAISRVSYEDVLFRAIEDCRRARVLGDLTRYSEAVMAFYDVLSPGLREKVKPVYDEVQAEAEKKIRETNDTLQTMSDPIHRASFYSTRLAEVERESADTLFRKMIEVLDAEGMLVRRREIEVRHL